MSKLKSKKARDYKVIEYHLRNYRNYRAGIKNMQKQLDHIMPNITASYELREGSVGSFTFSSKTEDYAIDRIESKRALQLHEDIAMYQLLVDSIDNALNELEKKERIFVKNRYFNNWDIRRVAFEMGYEERNVFFIRRAIKGKLLISLKNIVNVDI